MRIGDGTLTAQLSLGFHFSYDQQQQLPPEKPQSGFFQPQKIPIGRDAGKDLRGAGRGYS